MALYFDALSARDLAKVKRKKEQEERRTEKRSAREKREAVIEQLHKISEMEESPSGSLEDPRYRPNIVAREHITADRPSGISTPIKGVAIAKGGQVKKYGYMGGGKVYAQPRKANYKAG